MRGFRQRVIRARCGGAVLGLAGLVAFAATAAQAKNLTVSGTETNRFSRILLEFDTATKVTARTTAGVVVLSFSKPVAVKKERLAADLRGTVALVRHDPDGSGMRLALIRPVQVNILEAGEKVFVDLLPSNWTGFPPGLPPDIVADLARRAREAEAKVRSESAVRRTEGGAPVGLRVSRLPTLTFETPKAVSVSLKAEGEMAELTFDAPLRLVAGDARSQLAPAVLGLRGETEAGAMRVSLTLAPGHEARGFRDEDSYVLDIGKAKPADAPTEAVEPPRPVAADRSPPAAVPPAAPPAPPAPPSNTPVRPTPAAALAAPVVTVQPSGPVRPTVTAGRDGVAIRFPFGTRTAAAAFERAGVVTAVFHSPAPIELAAWPTAAAPFADLVGVEREGAFTVVRLALKGSPVMRLAPQGEAWVLTLGDTGLVPVEPLAVHRAVDDAGRTSVNVPLFDVSGVHWLKGSAGGERIAAVTAFGAPRGALKPQHFVEFRLLPSAHGLAVAADADDVVVRADLDGVGISRSGGLAVSPDGHKGASSAATPDLVLSRDGWMRDRLGAVREGERALTLAAVAAPRSGRSQARLDLARLHLANGLDHEAVGVLTVAALETPGLASQRPFILLLGIAQARARRDAEARRLLAGEIVAEDPEAVLWRALLDARAGLWPQALVGFRRSGAVLDRYADDLQVTMRSAAAQAALETKELAAAEGELTTAGQFAPAGLAHDGMALLRARLEEASGRGDEALDAYRELAAKAERPVAAEATLRLVSLALREKVMEPEAAITRLETLSVVWRGDEIEVATLGALGRLYAEGARWRDAFTIARRANRIFPDHQVTRALHEETARLFEDLFLTGKGDTLSQVEALALYFDFKEFTPIGRRGDEIVRRLADRLIELDLLEQAGDLLQHQVDKRLAGSARATVAARLATVRLMDGKPQAALGAIQATRLPELPAAIKRARLLIEARALSDLSRTDLALEVLDGEAGPEIERLRADILWNGRRWREAGEAHEHLVGLRWRGPEPLTDGERADVTRAAIAYSLDDENLALDRLRTKFAAKMADSPDARTFGLLTRPNVSASPAFRDIARGVTSADTLSDFLGEYRKRYPEAAVAERRRRPVETSAQPEAPAVTKPQAQAPAGAPAARS